MSDDYSEMVAKWKATWDLQDKYALQLGKMCLVWAFLDRSLDEVIEQLLCCSKSQAASITSAVTDVAPRCEIIKRLIVLSHPGESWRDWFIALIQRVSGELAPTRNRYIHDEWQADATTIVRRDKRAKIGREQARQPLSLSFDTKHPTSPNEIEQFTMKVATVLAFIETAKIDLRIWQQGGQIREPNPQDWEGCKPNARYQTPREDIEAERLGLPTGGLVFH